MTINILILLLLLLIIMINITIMIMIITHIHVTSTMTTSFYHYFLSPGRRSRRWIIPKFIYLSCRPFYSEDGEYLSLFAYGVVFIISKMEMT